MKQWWMWPYLKQLLTATTTCATTEKVDRSAHDNNLWFAPFTYKTNEIKSLVTNQHISFLLHTSRYHVFTPGQRLQIKSFNLHLDAEKQCFIMFVDSNDYTIITENTASKRETTVTMEQKEDEERQKKKPKIELDDEEVDF